MARAGTFVSLASDGTLQVERGFVLPEDMPAEPEETGNADGSDEYEHPAYDGRDERIADYGSDEGAVGDSIAPDVEPEEEDGIKPLPDRLLTELTAWRTLALRDAFASNPHIALDPPLQRRPHLSEPEAGRSLLRRPDLRQPVHRRGRRGLLPHLDPAAQPERGLNLTRPTPPGLSGRGFPGFLAGSFRARVIVLVARRETQEEYEAFPQPSHSTMREGKPRQGHVVPPILPDAPVPGRRSTIMPVRTIPLPVSGMSRSNWTCRPSSGRRPRVSGLPGSSGITATGRSLALNAGPPSSPLFCAHPAMPIIFGKIPLVFLSLPSTGRRSWANDPSRSSCPAAADPASGRMRAALPSACHPLR
ncbi:putative ParB-like nuclease [Gluconacetobacter sp. SXCC-1]|nr:putative ParB-like nuclease [Gluconacetobacter sp. SXCC-1]